MSLNFFIAIFIFGAPTFAKNSNSRFIPIYENKRKVATAPVSYLLSYSQFRKLNLKTQAEYLDDLRKVFIEFEKDQGNIRYQTQNFDQRTNFAGYFWSLVGIDEACASEGSCIYAGYVSSYNSRGYCQRPTSEINSYEGTCAGGQTLCNPVIFGMGPGKEGFCTSSKSYPTRDCERQYQATPDYKAIDIAKRLNSDPKFQKGFSKSEDELKSYCNQSTTNRQQSLCKFLSNRVATLNGKIDQLKKADAAKTQTSTGLTRSLTPSDTKGMDGSSSSNKISTPAEPVPTVANKGGMDGNDPFNANNVPSSGVVGPKFDPYFSPQRAKDGQTDGNSGSASDKSPNDYVKNNWDASNPTTAQNSTDKPNLALESGQYQVKPPAPSDSLNPPDRSTSADPTKPSEPTQYLNADQKSPFESSSPSTGSGADSSGGSAPPSRSLAQQEPPATAPPPATDSAPVAAPAPAPTKPTAPPVSQDPPKPQRPKGPLCFWDKASFDEVKDFLPPLLKRVGPTFCVSGRKETDPPTEPDYIFITSNFTSDKTTNAGSPTLKIAGAQQTTVFGTVKKDNYASVCYDKNILTAKIAGEEKQFVFTSPTEVHYDGKVFHPAPASTCRDGMNGKAQQVGSPTSTGSQR